MRYRVFGKHTGLRVSQLALGTGNFGTTWGYGAEPDEARRMFGKYIEVGGNFIDTADNYQAGQSETLLSDLIAPVRERLVLASKFTLGPTPAQAGIAATGNSRKVMIQSVESSLKRLKTDRIDLLWVHMPDGVTPMEEVMRGLDDLARAGKIVYAGLSDFPAWRVSRAATLAELRGSLPIAGVQLEYSLVERTAERELLPMAQALGLGTVAWSPLGGGLLTGKYRRGELGRATQLGTLIHHEDSAQKGAVLDALQVVADETESNPGRVAIAWVMARGAIPIVGPKSLAQMDDNLGATELRLTEQQLLHLNAAGSPSLGFPHELLSQDSVRQSLAGGQLDQLDAPDQPIA
ncbi:aldo/keto reductase [Massilia sp. ML15P13]|uniref:Aldo/keto reductase n=2 Tax=Telluria aromaticivorans TaxID=2725995 RepID=A0A7Y2K0U0_9BURK|nr:aldo/keto reductase [Telluria aromaticivorans]